MNGRRTIFDGDRLAPARIQVAMQAGAPPAQLQCAEAWVGPHGVEIPGSNKRGDTIRQLIPWHRVLLVETDAGEGGS